MDGFGIGIDYVADIDECRVVEGEVIVFDFGLCFGIVGAHLLILYRFQKNI